MPNIESDMSLLISTVHGIPPQEGQRWMTSTPISVGSLTPVSTRSRSSRLDVSDVGVSYTTFDEEYMDRFKKIDDDPDPHSYINRELVLDCSCYFFNYYY